MDWDLEAMEDAEEVLDVEEMLLPMLRLRAEPPEFRSLSQILQPIGASRLQAIARGRRAAELGQHVASRRMALGFSGGTDRFLQIAMERILEGLVDSE